MQERKTTRYRCPLYATNLSDECEVIVSSRSELMEHLTEDHFKEDGVTTFIEEVTDSFLEIMAYIRGLERYRK